MQQDLGTFDRSGDQRGGHGRHKACSSELGDGQGLALAAWSQRKYNLLRRIIRLAASQVVSRLKVCSQKIIAHPERHGEYRRYAQQRWDHASIQSSKQRHEFTYRRIATENDTPRHAIPRQRLLHHVYRTSVRPGRGRLQPRLRQIERVACTTRLA